MKLGVLLMFCLAISGAELTPDEALARLRERMSAQRDRIPNYTCVETMSREVYAIRGSRPTCASAGEFPWLAARRDLATSDKFRIDVRVGQGAEMYSWPGADRFGAHELIDFLGSGAISTGAFGTFLLGVFGEAPELRFVERRSIEGRNLFVYEYNVPLEQSHRLFLAAGLWVPIAYKGYILLDAESGELVRFMSRTVDLPRESRCCESNTDITYQKVRLGDDDFLIPVTATDTFLGVASGPFQNPPDSVSRNTATFSACRLYTAESTIRFGEEPGPAEQGRASTPGSSALVLPGGLSVSVALEHEIDPATAAGGDPFTARLIEPIRSEKKELVKMGALVHGRITRVEQFHDAKRVEIALDLESVDVDGASAPLQAIAKESRAIRLPTRGFASAFDIRKAMIEIDPALAKWRVAVLSLSGGQRVLPRGRKLQWVTLEPKEK
jgi:hypothetical protein